MRRLARGSSRKAAATQKQMFGFFIFCFFRNSFNEWQVLLLFAVDSIYI
jgi:hypothetical protein